MKSSVSDTMFVILTPAGYPPALVSPISSLVSKPELESVCIPLLTKSLQLQIRNKIENNRTVSDYRRYSFNSKRALEGSWSVVRSAHFQAFTLKLPQDHGRLSDKHIAKHSR